MKNNSTLIIGFLLIVSFMIAGIWAIDKDDARKKENYVRRGCWKFSKTMDEFRECMK